MTVSEDRKREGWDVFNIGDDDHPVFDIQKNDENDIFASDAEALGHVVFRAVRLGDEECREAILKVASRWYSPYNDGLERMRWALYGPFVVNRLVRDKGMLRSEAETAVLHREHEARMVLRRMLLEKVEIPIQCR